MSPSRRALLWSGLAGLCLNGLLAALATWLVASSIIPPLLPQPVVALAMVLILGGISVAEIPLMIFAMRRLVAERPATHPFVLGLHAVYVFFSAVYALPVLLLTGNRVWGWLLCSLGLVRLATSLLLVPTRVALTADSHPGRDVVNRPARARQPTSDRPAGSSEGLTRRPEEGP